MLHTMPSETCLARLLIISCNPFSPWQSAVFTCFFSSLFLSQQLQSAANLRPKGQFKLLRPTQLGASSPHPLFSAYLCRHWSFFGDLRHRGQVPRYMYIARLLTIQMSLCFLLLAHGESTLGLVPFPSSPLHEIGILTLSRLNFGRGR